MTPPFSKAVDPIFLYVLDLLDRIERNEMPVVSDERVRIRARIDQAEAQLGQREDWNLAKYALVAWIDDLLIEAPWEGRTAWENRPLEVELFGRREAYSAFYSKAVDASALTKKDALEVFYVCVVLGFRGLYRDASGVSLAQQLGMPADVELWAKKTAMAIHLAQGRPPIAETPREGDGGPPLEGKFNLIAMSLLCFMLLSAALLMGWLMYFT